MLCFSVTVKSLRPKKYNAINFLEPILNYVQLSKTKIELCICSCSSQFSGGLIGFASSLCCHGDAGVGRGRMWGSQSPHEADQSHDQGRGGMAAPFNTYSE